MQKSKTFDNFKKIVNEIKRLPVVKSFCSAFIPLLLFNIITYILEYNLTPETDIIYMKLSTYFYIIFFILYLSFFFLINRIYPSSNKYIFFFHVTVGICYLVDMLFFHLGIKNLGFFKVYFLFLIFQFFLVLFKKRYRLNIKA